MATKKCKKCGRELPISEFRKWRCTCKQCELENIKQYYYDNREKRIEYSHQYRQTFKGHCSRVWNNCINGDIKAGRITKESLPDDYITLEQTMELIGIGKCAHYDVCGCNEWIKLGLNRKDNSKYHTYENCEPCCYECNLRLEGEELSKKLSKKVYQYKNGKLIKIWDSTNECDKNGYVSSAVSKCCNNKFHKEGNNTYKGYEWSYNPL